jgi:hypothetical protein
MNKEDAKEIQGLIQRDSCFVSPTRLASASELGHGVVALTFYLYMPERDVDLIFELNRVVAAAMQQKH